MSPFRIAPLSSCGEGLWLFEGMLKAFSVGTVSFRLMLGQTVCFCVGRVCEGLVGSGMRERFPDCGTFVATGIFNCNPDEEDQGFDCLMALAQDPSHLAGKVRLIVGKTSILLTEIASNANARGGTPNFLQDSFS